jgi:hypothetical protein
VVVVVVDDVVVTVAPFVFVFVFVFVETVLDTVCRFVEELSDADMMCRVGR